MMIVGDNPFEAAARANVQVLRQFRPELIDRMAEPSGSHRYELASGRDGEATLARIEPTGMMAPCMPDGAPTAYLRSLRERLPRNLVEPVGVAGLGDGSLISLLSRLGPDPKAVGAVQPVVVVEPDPSLLAASLHLHDFRGQGGPIADARFHFCVGEDWERQLAELLLEDGRVPFPSCFLHGGTVRRDITTGLERQATRFVQRLESLRERVKRQYAARDPRERAALLSRQPPRPPRALIITSRFTTVLQYTAAHLGEAFQSLGFAAQVLLEEQPFHRVTPYSMLRTIAECEPDVVVFPDHLSHEFPGVFPEGLPFVCWAQDELPNMSNREAGRKLGPTEFVWVREVDTYRDAYGYPDSRLVEATSLTVERPAVEPPTHPSHDLIYFSHASWARRRIEREPVQWGLVHGVGEGVLDELSRELVRRYLQDEEVVDLYAFCGEVVPELGSLPPMRRRWDGRRVVRERRQTTRLELCVRALAQARGVLHRQQGLRWAARLAAQRGSRLSIYGNGWADLDEFAAYARGPADYRTEVGPLSQNARVNLVLEPWAVVSHWRGLDALASGATLLARRETFRESAFAALAHRLQGGPSMPRSVAEALEGTSGDDRQQLLEILERIQLLPFARRDPIEYVAAQLQQGTAPEAIMSLPALGHFCFASADELWERMQWLEREPRESRRLGLELRRHVLERYSYAVGARALCDDLYQRLSGPETSS